MQSSHEGILSRFCEQQKTFFRLSLFCFFFFCPIHRAWTSCVSSAHSLSHIISFSFSFDMFYDVRVRGWEGKAEKYFYSWFLIILFFAHMELWSCKRNLCVCQKKKLHSCEMTMWGERVCCRVSGGRRALKSRFERYMWAVTWRSKKEELWAARMAKTFL